MYCADTGQVLADGEVRDLLDLAAGLRRQALAPGEVEPQVARLVVGTGLERGRAEHLAQRRVHHVGAGVRLAGRDAPVGVDLGGARPGRSAADR